ncbi:hypothetical protein [Clostridium sp.]|uniref:hypothetical protein n=1 Tax=Clostridium sp. TaxID=1506 RepID=UPI001B555440|nr:hypothetical protein [Clostridium sp.]MBP3916743.1 hypothetical protein [Clostridium sp.]
MAKKLKSGYKVLGIIIAIAALYTLFLFGFGKANENEDVTLQNYYELKEEKSYIYKLKNFIDANIDKLSKEDATIMIEDYLYVLQDKADSLSYYIAYMSYELRDMLDDNIIESYRALDNEAVKGLFLDAEKLGISMRKVYDNYEFYVDAEKFLKLYGEYIDEETKDIMILVNDISYDDIEDDDFTGICRKLYEKVDLSFDIEDKYPDMEDKDNLLRIRNQYLSILFCLDSTDAYEDVENKKYYEDYLNTIREAKDVLKNEKCIEYVDNLFKIIDENDGCLTLEVKNIIDEDVTEE